MVTIYFTDSRFQVQGVIGLILFVSIGFGCTFLRLLLGVFILMSMRRSQKFLKGLNVPE